MFRIKSINNYHNYEFPFLSLLWSVSILGINGVGEEWGVQIGIFRLRIISLRLTIKRWGNINGVNLYYGLGNADRIRGLESLQNK